MNILVDGISVYYRDEGVGPIVLLLHGWGSDSSSFDSLSASLSPTNRVLRLDLPGMGRSGPTSPGGWNVYQYGAFVSRFLSKLGIREVDVLIGHSMGGRIALRSLPDKAIDAKKLILISSAGIVNTTTKKTGYKFLAKFGKLFTFFLPKSTKHELKQKLYRSAGASDYIGLEGDKKTTFEKVISEDLRQYAKLIRVPTLLIYGSLDDQTPVSFGQEFESLIPGSRLSVIEGGDHFVHQTSADQVSELVKGFIG